MPRPSYGLLDAAAAADLPLAAGAAQFSERRPEKIYRGFHQHLFFYEEMKSRVIPSRN